MSGKFHMILDYRKSITIEQFEILSYLKEEKTALMKDAFYKALHNILERSA